MPLAAQITRLYTAFVNLRRHVLWRSHVTGGAAFCEIKRGNDGMWHPHLHILVEGDYLAQRLLSQAWLCVTGDSSVVDIRACRNMEEVRKYVTKYVTKPIDHSIMLEPRYLDEAVFALKGRRLCMTFGSWRGIVLEPSQPPDDREWKAVGRLDALIAASERGDPHATAVMLLLRVRKESHADSS